MRITKKERKKNANQFYNMFMNGSCDEAAIVAQKCVSTNPNINKIQQVIFSYKNIFLLKNDIYEISVLLPSK